MSRTHHIIATLVLGSLAVIGCSKQLSAEESQSPTSTNATSPLTDAQLTAAVLHVRAASCAAEGQKTGTAFVVDVDNSLIVSVAHILDGAASPILTDSDGNTVEANLVYRDNNRDIALFQPVLSAQTNNSMDQAALTLGPRAVGTTVRYVSHSSIGAPEIFPATILRYSQLTLDGIGNRAGIELEASVDKGDSGAPVVDGNGQVIGMVFAADQTPRVGWAIAAEEIRQAIDTAGASSAGGTTADGNPSPMEPDC